MTSDKSSLSNSPDSVKQLSLFEHVEIPLTKGYVAFVDPIDADLADTVWFAHRSYSGRDCHYAEHSQRVNGARVGVMMHRIILARIIGRPLLQSEVADHIDLNGLNNRRANLRLATNAENARNHPTPKTNTSGYKGVSWHKHSQKWRATIMYAKKWINIGYFDTPEAAYAAYCATARELHGEFARVK